MPLKKDTGYSLNKLTQVYNTENLGTNVGRQNNNTVSVNANASGGILLMVMCIIIFSNLLVV